MIKKTTRLVGKKILAERISISSNKEKKNSLTKVQIEAIIGNFLEELKKSLMDKEEIRFPGYFSFKTLISKPRVAMNLKTRKKMMIPAKRTLKAKFSNEFKKEIAQKK